MNTKASSSTGFRRPAAGETGRGGDGQSAPAAGASRLAPPVTSLRLPGILRQDQVWVNAAGVDDLATMDPDHRANLIPFLRRSAQALHQQHLEDLILDQLDDPERARPPGPWETSDSPQEWLAASPLMRRLVELEQGRPIGERRATAERNAEHEAATGYQKVTLITAPPAVCDCPSYYDMESAALADFCPVHGDPDLVSW